MKFIALLFFCILTQIIRAQEKISEKIDLSLLTDDLIGYQNEDGNYSEVYENYIQLLSNPVELNSASAEDLQLLNILSDKQIEQFLHYKQENGNLLSIHELQAIPEFDNITIHKLMPFVIVENPTEQINKSLTSRLFQNENNYIIARYERTLEKSAGYDQTNPQYKFKGSPDNLYLRFRSSRPNDFSIGFTAEKDAGEKLSWNPTRHQYGTDYFSFHAQLLNKKRIKNLVIGDYQMQFAQGLLLGGAFGLGKSAETVVATRKSNIGFLPYTSVNEAANMRGIATTYAISNTIFLSGFYSRTMRDATVQDYDQQDNTFSSIILSGLHRNDNELAKRKSIAEKNYGTILNYKNDNMDAGVIFHGIEYSTMLTKTPTVYNQFNFSGVNNHNTGIFINYTINNVNLFAEAGKSLKGGNGVVAGALASLSSTFDVAILYRKYDRDFFSFSSNAFSECTNPQNESGIYWGWKYRWSKKYSLNGYLDLFTFPWLRFRAYAPASGYEWLLRFTYQPTKHISMFVQAREESKARNTTEANNVYKTAPGQKHNYCLNFGYNVHPNIRLRTRAQFSRYTLTPQTTSGMVLLQDLNYSFGKLDISLRHALFDTDDFDNRQYVYENDVWLAYSLPAYYGKGIRNYIVVEYKINAHTSVWLRYSRTKYTDRNEISSGINLIKASVLNDIKLQIRVKL
jgi:hypothetical protein